MIRDFGLLLAVGIAMICLVQHRRPARGPRHPRVQVTDHRQGLPPGVLGRLVVWLGNLPTKIAPVLIVGSILIFVGGVIVEDKLTLQTDPIEWVNQDSQVIEDLDRLQAETQSSSELGMFVESDDIFDDETVEFVDQFAKEQLAEYPEELLTASSIVTTVELPDGDPGGRRRAAHRGRGRSRLRRGPRGHPALHRQRRRERAQPDLPHRGQQPRRARGGRPRDPRHRRPAAGGHRHPVRAGGGGRRAPRQPRGEPDPAHLPRDPVRVPVPHGAAAQRRAVPPVAGAGADRGRARPRWWPTRSGSSSAR